MNAKRMTCTGLVALGVLGGIAIPASSAASAATPTRLADSTVNVQFLASDVTQHNLILQPSQTTTVGLSGLPKVITPGSTLENITLSVDPDFGQINTTDHAIAQYVDSTTGSTYTVTIAVSAPQANGSDEVQLIGYGSYLHGQRLPDINGMFDVTLQRAGQPGAMMFR